MRTSRRLAEIERTCPDFFEIFLNIFCPGLSRRAPARENREEFPNSLVALRYWQNRVSDGKLFLVAVEKASFCWVSRQPLATSGASPAKQTPARRLTAARVDT